MFITFRQIWIPLVSMALSTCRRTFLCQTKIYRTCYSWVVLGSFCHSNTFLLHRQISVAIAVLCSPSPSVPVDLKCHIQLTKASGVCWRVQSMVFFRFKMLMSLEAYEQELVTFREVQPNPVLFIGPKQHSKAMKMTRNKSQEDTTLILS